MADTPTPAYSVRIRVRMENKPGMLGHLAIAIGEVGANISALQGFEVKTATLDEDVVVNCTSEAHQEQVRAAVESIDGIEILECEDRTFHMHEGGKIEVLPLAPVRDVEDLSMAYTPGVARVCLEIAKNPAAAHRYTIKKNTVAIVSDGTAVLGLGDIGPAAAMPVMEGKALLFKHFAGVDAFPICLDTKDPEEIIETVLRLEPTFGMSVWWRDHADHHMRMLMSPEGPFADSRDQNGQGEPLPYTAPPAGMFVDVRLLPS